MEFFRQWSNCLAEKSDLFGQKSPLTCFGLKHDTLYSYKVANVKLFKQGIGLLADFVFFYVRLKLPGIVPEMEEGRLSKRPDPHNATCHGKYGRIVHGTSPLINVLFYCSNRV